jgi:hypothetical protein
MILSAHLMRFGRIKVPKLRLPRRPKSRFEGSRRTRIRGERLVCESVSVCRFNDNDDDSDTRGDVASKSEGRELMDI